MALTRKQKTNTIAIMRELGEFNVLNLALFYDTKHGQRINHRELEQFMDELLQKEEIRISREGMFTRFAWCGPKWK